MKNLFFLFFCSWNSLYILLVVKALTLILLAWLSGLIFCFKNELYLMREDCFTNWDKSLRKIFCWKKRVLLLPFFLKHFQHFLDLNFFWVFNPGVFSSHVQRRPINILLSYGRMFSNMLLKFLIKEFGYFCFILRKLVNGN